MKKAIAALLSTFVGIFGFQIADKAIDERVSDLEYSVSSQQEEIESLHRIGKYEETTTAFYEGETTDKPDESSSHTSLTVTPSVSITDFSYDNISVGDRFDYNGSRAYKIRIYSDASFKFINPGTELLESELDISVPISVTATVPIFAVKDSWFYIDYAYFTVTSIDNITKICYDEEYNPTEKITGYNASIDVVVSGRTDKALAGQYIRVFYLNSTNDPYGPIVKVKEDGSFSDEFTVIYTNYQNQKLGVNWFPFNHT